MSYVSSDKIHVFPFGTTRTTDRLARVLNEQNLTTIVKNMTDIPNYVLRYENNIMDFIIQGYYFSADVSEIKENNKPLYAYINLTTDNSGYSYLSGNDTDDGVFTGVIFTTSDSGIPADQMIQLLDKSHKVPTSSKQRLSGESLNGGGVDVDAVNAAIDEALMNINRIYCGNAFELIN